MGYLFLPFLLAAPRNALQILQYSAIKEEPCGALSRVQRAQVAREP